MPRRLRCALILLVAGCGRAAVGDAGDAELRDARDGAHALDADTSIDATDARPATDAPDATRPSTCPAGWLCPATPIYTSQIGAWYSLAESAITGVPACNAAWASSRYEPVRGYYDSASPATIDQHFAEMHAAGIGFLVLDFTNGIAPDPSASAIYAAGETLLRREADPTAPIHIPFALAIGAQLWSSHSLTGQQNEADFVLDHYAAPGGTPNPWYFQWRGRPLLVNYNSYDAADAFHPEWDDARFYVGRSNPVLNVASTALARYGNSWWGWVDEYPMFVAADVVTVSPGADDTHYCGCIGVIRYDRNGGSNATCADCDATCTQAPRGCPAFNTRCSAAITGGAAPANGAAPGLMFELAWLRAIKHNPSAILITSYNDYGDETAIEPARARTDGSAPAGAGTPWTDYYGVETPDWYLQIASAYAHLRVGLEPDGYYRDEDGSVVFQLAGGALVPQSTNPHGHPTIILPAGTLAGLGAVTPHEPTPAEGTVMVAPGLPPAVIAGGAAVRFEVTATAMHFGTPQTVTAGVYLSVPYGGTIHANAPVYGAPSLPPAFESDQGELWPVSCLEAISDNGSHIDPIQVAAEYAAFPQRAALNCR